MFAMFMRAIPRAIFLVLRTQSRHNTARTSLSRRGLFCSYSGLPRLMFIACDRDAAASLRERREARTNIGELHARWALVNFFFFANSWQRRIATQIFSIFSSVSVE